MVTGGRHPKFNRTRDILSQESVAPSELTCCPRVA